MIVLTFIGLSFLLLLSFYLLARVCDEYFVGALDKIAKRFKMSDDAAGATLMAIGSSAPELFIAIIALVKPGDHAAIGMATIVGSALFNILVIIGVAAIVRKAVLAWQPVIRDMIFYSLSIILLIVAFWDGSIDLFEATLFVALYVIYVMAVISWRKILPYKDGDSVEVLEKGLKKEKKKAWWKTLMKPFDKILDIFFPKEEKYFSVFFVSIIIIAAVSWVLVESAIVMADIIHIPAYIMALTVLAAGTSVPDLISSVIVARQGRGGMAISNAIGSNIFDILVGLGVPWLIMLSVSSGVIPVATSNLLSSVILLFATVFVIFILLVSRKWKIGRFSGWFLIFLYVLYVFWAVLH
jgi:K+-dependent Na+/Ca+ exchanger-like protein